MLGLNKKRTLYTITAYYYNKIISNNNTQQWNSTPLSFKCNYAKSEDVTKLSTNQGISVSSITLETDSPINFSKGDKVVIDNQVYLVNSQVMKNNPLTAKYTNKPSEITKLIMLN